MLHWRQMREGDLSEVMRLAQSVHQELYESEAVFAERLKLFPKGCLILSSDKRIEGYVFSHPIRRCQPPALNTMLLELPCDTDSYFFHDLVVAPACRRSGHAIEGITRLLSIAKSFQTTSLIAVYGTSKFWTRFGFVPAQERMCNKLASYGKNVVYMLRDNTRPTGC